MPSNPKLSELQRAVGLYQAVNKYLTELSKGNSLAVDHLTEIKSNLPELVDNLTDLEMHAKHLQETLETYASRFKLPNRNSEEVSLGDLEMQLDTLIAENAVLLSKAKEEDLVLIADYQQSIGKQLSIAIRTKELMDDILPKLEESINLQKWPNDVNNYFEKMEADLPTLLNLHRAYYDLFANTREDENEYTVQLHNRIEDAIEEEVKKILELSPQATTLLALIRQLEANIIPARHGSPTLLQRLHPLLEGSFKECGRNVLNQSNTTLSDLVMLSKIYEGLYVEAKKTPSPLTQKVMAKLELALILQFKNDLNNPDCNKKKTKEAFESLPQVIQEKIKDAIGARAFSEPRQTLMTQYAPKRARKITPPGGPPEVKKTDPKKPRA